MRHSAKKLMALLTAAAMMCSSAPASAFAADTFADSGAAPAAQEAFTDSGKAPEEPSAAPAPPAVNSALPVSDDDLPRVDLLEDDYRQYKYIYANSSYNSLDQMPKMINPKGRYKGREVTLIPEKWKGPDKLLNDNRGSAGSWYGPNDFSIDIFTVEDTGERVRSIKPVELHVYVIGVSAVRKLNTTQCSIKRSDALNLTEKNWKTTLKLPASVSVDYKPIENNSNDYKKWLTEAGDLDASAAPKSYNITGWYMKEYSLDDVAAEHIRNAVLDGKTQITLWPMCKSGDVPQWATPAGGEFIITITPDPQAVVTVTAKDKTYDGKPADVSAEATAGGQKLADAKFGYNYKGINGTDYDNWVPPTDAGTYEVKATLTTEGYSGSASARFTIAKAAEGTTKAYCRVPNGKELTIQVDDDSFITTGMAKGAKIKEPPGITGGDLIESGTAVAGAAKFTLKSKSDAPNGSTQTFDLVLTSHNYDKVTVAVTVYNDNVVVSGVKLKPNKEGKTEYPDGTALSEIMDLSGCVATVNGNKETGKFALVDPDRALTGPDVYKNWPFWVLFTTGGGVEYQVQVSAPEFTILAKQGGDATPDSEYLKNGYFITLFANSRHNQSADTLLALVQERKGSYAMNGKTYTAAWRAESGSPAFEPKGYKNNVWYTYTAALAGHAGAPKAYIRVVPVNSTPSGFLNSSGSIKASDVQSLAERDWKEKLGLPSVVVLANEPAEKVLYQNPDDQFKAADEYSSCTINSWLMDGKPLTLDALKSKAAGATAADVTVTLTPVYTTAAWATLSGETPTFRLTITPKIPVDVIWNGPATPITYGEPLQLGAPSQMAKDGNGIDETGAFTWDYVYYKADGITRLNGRPTDAGVYQVQAVLSSKTHSGASERKSFEIKAKSIEGLAFDPASAGDMDPVYNKRPHTPEYTVKDGAAVLKKDTDYRADYRDNINAGTAKVIFTGIGNYTGAKEVAFTIQKLPLDPGQKPAVSGGAAAGQVLSASLAGVDPAELEWIWAADGVAVTGSAAVSYEVRPENSNKVITVTAKARDSGNYSGTSGVSDGKRVAKVKIAGAVTVTAAGSGADGSVTAGTVLTAKAGVIPDAAETGGVWSWKVDGTVKEGAASSVYTVADGDKEIAAVFTPGADYTGSVESARIEVGKMLLTGTVSAAKEPADTAPLAVGSRLKAAVSGGPASGAFTYIWLRDGEPVSGAAGETYTITAADRGRTVSVKVTADGYTGELVSGGINIPAAVPGAPAGVRAAAGSQLLNISWRVPADDGGAPVTGYKLKVTRGEADVLPEVTLAANVLSYRLEGLTNGTEYSVSVRAFNRMGTGETGTAVGTPKASGGGGSDDSDDSDDTGGSSGTDLTVPKDEKPVYPATPVAPVVPVKPAVPEDPVVPGDTTASGDSAAPAQPAKTPASNEETDILSQTGKKADWIPDLIILTVYCVGMGAVLLKRRRTYKEKIPRE